LPFPIQKELKLYIEKDTPSLRGSALGRTKTRRQNRQANNENSDSGVDDEIVHVQLLSFLPREQLLAVRKRPKKLLAEGAL